MTRIAPNAHYQRNPNLKMLLQIFRGREVAQILERTSTNSAT